MQYGMERLGSLQGKLLQSWEEVAAERMDRIRAMRKYEGAEQSPEMVDLFLSLSSAAITLSTMAPNLDAVDLYVEISE